MSDDTSWDITATVQAGGDVVLPPGIFRHSGLTIPADTTIIGSGPTTVLLCENAAAAASVVPAGDNITIANLTLDNETGSQVQGVRYSGETVLSGFVLDGVRCVNHVALMRVSNMTDVRIVNCWASLHKVSAWNGVMVSAGCSDWIISGNTIKDASEEGISVDAAGGTKPTDVVIVGNRVRGTGRTGIIAHQCERVTISGNVVTGVTGTFPGIASSTDDNGIRNVLVAITGNVIRDCIADGIRVTQTDGATVCGNTISDIAGTADNVYGSGIFTSSATEVAVVGNVIRNVGTSTTGGSSALAGVRVNATNSTVVGNIVSGVTNQAAISVTGTGCSTANNVTV